LSSNISSIHRIPQAELRKVPCPCGAEQLHGREIHPWGIAMEEKHGKIMGKSTLHENFEGSQWQTKSGMVHVPTIDAVDY